MRCKACNRLLSKSEAVSTDDSGNYEDMCNKCKRLSGVHTDGETKLMNVKDELSILEEYTVEYDYEGEAELIEELTGGKKYSDLLDNL